jgi:hypothetical protein
MADTRRVEFGDFQTPRDLALQVARVLAASGVAPASVVEPTCGLGSFVGAALDVFGECRTLRAFDVNPAYVEHTRASVAPHADSGKVVCQQADFFKHDWAATLAVLPEPTLVVGNPPWVTSSVLGALESANLPQKTNFQNLKGLDALTGKSNFDVAEWMLLKLLESGRRRALTLAMLVKTSVARRVLTHVWRTALPVVSADMYVFDAGRHFSVSTDACLFVCALGDGPLVRDCPVRELDRPNEVRSSIGWRDGSLLADVGLYDRYRAALAEPSQESAFRWRSGVKHDCANVMELRRDESGRLLNGFDLPVDIEPEYLYPMLKGTELVKGTIGKARRWLIVTQSRTGEDTEVISRRAPRTWAYLCEHGDRLDRRRSSIYRKRHRFSVFGVGPYTFAPWKVAVSALHKQLVFATVGPVEGRPAVFDDTCYHLSCTSEDAARLLGELLRSEPASGLLRAFLFWDAKRPITTDVLQRLDLRRVATLLGRGERFGTLFGDVSGDPKQAAFGFGSIVAG